MKCCILFILLFTSFSSFAQTSTQKEVVCEFIKRYNNGNDDILKLYYNDLGRQYTNENRNKAGKEIRNLRYHEIGEITLQSICLYSNDTIDCTISAKYASRLLIGFVGDEISYFEFFAFNHIPERKKVIHKFIECYNSGNDDIIDLYYNNSEKPYTTNDYNKAGEEIRNLRDHKVGKITLHEIRPFSQDSIECIVLAKDTCRLLFGFVDDKISSFKFLKYNMVEDREKVVCELIKRYNNGNNNILDLYYNESGKIHSEDDYFELGEKTRSLRDKETGKVSLREIRHLPGDTVECLISAEKHACILLTFIGNKVGTFEFKRDRRIEEILTPEEMKKDVDFFFEKIYELHPNPYYYCGIKCFEETREKIYSQITKPMSIRDFILSLAKINVCLDSHTALHLRLYHFEIFDINIENLQISLKKDKKRRIVKSINGVPVSKLSDFFMSFQNTKLRKETQDFHFGRSLEGLMDIFGIGPPYQFEFKNGEYELLVKTPYKVPSIMYFDIYEKSSVAIFSIVSFSNDYYNELEQQLLIFRDSIDKCGIKNVFIDVSNNVGGNNPPPVIYDLVTHDSLIWSEKYIGKGNIITDELTNGKYESKTDRQLFVIMSAATYSAGDYFCRAFKHNNLGVLVGQNSGSETIDFTSILPFRMPFSVLDFQVSKAFIDFSSTCPTPALVPDMYWDTNNRWYYPEEELRDIIKAWNKKTKKKKK